MAASLFAGSFDPITIGHCDIISRAADVFGDVTVAVMVNDSKQPFLSYEERCELIKLAFKGDERINVLIYKGLLTELADELQCSVNIRGLRNSNDFIYERDLTDSYNFLNPSMENVYFMSAPQHRFISSSMVRELLKYGKKVSGLMPAAVENKLYEILGGNYGEQSE